MTDVDEALEGLWSNVFRMCGPYRKTWLRLFCAHLKAQGSRGPATRVDQFAMDRLEVRFSSIVAAWPFSSTQENPNSHDSYERVDRSQLSPRRNPPLKV
jgi:hypothetical protein